jgi:hypothetical protein
METVIHKEIEKRVSRSKKGRLFFLNDFRGLGSEMAIRKALSRLHTSGKIKRIAQGIYVVPTNDNVLGVVMPSLEKIAEAVAEREHIKIKPVGAYALHKLGLTTQVPTKLVYITDGPRRIIRLGRTSIRFKPTTPKKLALQGALSSLIIQALEELGTESIDATVKERLTMLLLKEDPRMLKHDLKMAPSRISEYIYSLLKESKND